MDFKHNLTDKCDKHGTPKSKVTIFGKRIAYSTNTDSPFRNLPSFSTPPSRFAKIINPFEPHLVERLHLPTFSPNVFFQNSTPKTEQKFRWTIEDISNLKPADIDEETVSQHVCHLEDPHIESLVQKRIETFFSKSEIVPSPMNVKVCHTPLIKDCSNAEGTPTEKKRNKTSGNEVSTQTLLTLPPVLPKELEDALKPYFGVEERESVDDIITDTSLYKRLFEGDDDAHPSKSSSCDDVHSLISSPALSTGMSPIQFSPWSKDGASPPILPELRDCTLSPISRPSANPTKISRSVCRLDFTDQMSVDASLVVPDTDNLQTDKSSLLLDPNLSPIGANEITMGNWSMEFKHISIEPSPSGGDCDRMDVSNSNTPHSKIFIGKGQRKRLSESFKSGDVDEENKENLIVSQDCSMQNRSKIFRNDLTDAGYYTQDTGCHTQDISEFSSHVFASTPSKRNHMKVEFGEIF